MKYTNCFLLVCLIGLAPGCAFNRPNVTLEPVGPAPPLTEASQAHEGDLVVYSAWDSGAPGEQGDVVVEHHADYKIYSVDGKLMKIVNNFVGTFVQDPATVSLLPGHYTVVARAANLGDATVPVLIEAGKTTAVYLDGSEPSVGSQSSTSDLVRLPGGLIVGWRAKDSSETK